MEDLITKLKQLPDYVGSNGRKIEEIENAEKVLNVIFSNDYKTYLNEIGLASFENHELTGITKNKNVSVVDCTIENRKLNPNVSNSMYVIEDAHIDGIVFWQNEKGEIYITSYDSKPKLYCKSMLEYLTK